MSTPKPTFAADVYALGCARYEQGKFADAQRWLKLAARYGHPDAVGKLAEVNALQQALASLEFGDTALAAFLDQLGVEDIDTTPDPADAVEAALHAYGEATLPPDFDANLRSFDELMQAVREVQSRDDQ